MCMCKWRMLDMASLPLCLIFLAYAGVRRTQIRRRLNIPGSACGDQARAFPPRSSPPPAWARLIDR